VANGGTSGPFTAAGGTPPYTWTVASTNLGTLNTYTGSNVTYTTTQTAGSNIITVTDSLNATAVATAIF
jgi:hypothetical protein